VLSDLLPLLGGLALAVWLYFLRESWRRRHRVHPPAPEITLQQAWENLLKNFEAHPDHDLFPPAIEFGEYQLDLSEPDGRRETRRKILDAVTAALHLEAIAALAESDRELLLAGYQAGMDPMLRSALAEANLRWIALRHYALLKFDDAVHGDWFHQFVWIAGSYIREKVRLARDHILAIDPSAGRLVEIYDELLASLRDDALDAPSKKRFVRPGL